jgi:light-regulated signal transduction histidine kinase (bacteriophytochrome)
VTAVDCLKQGATDYVLKGALARLPTAIRRSLQEARFREQRRKTEQALADKVEELARSNKELEQFAYIASHDLQEPLRMVASYTELLAERYRGKLDDKADKYIAYAVDGARRMQGLINDLLAYARVGSRAKPLQATDSAAVLALVIGGLQNVIESSHAEIVQQNLPAVLADDVQLGQVLQNLIANAIKFRHRERAPRVHVRAEPQDDFVRFSVADNGIGMEMENTGRIFQMFQRLHTREEYDGTGIGLAVAKKVVERHGGQIWFESVPGEGTTFHFTMPRAAVKMEKEADVQAAASAAGGG